MAAVTRTESTKSKLDAAEKERKVISEAIATKVLKVRPETIKAKLVTKTSGEKATQDLHHEVLLETQDVVDGNLMLLTDMQLLQRAIRQRDSKRNRAQESVMQMFVTKCLSTGVAWLLQAFGYQLISFIMNRASPGDPSDAGRVLLAYTIYASIVCLLAPPAEYWFAKKGCDCSQYLASMRRLQCKAFPMTIAWGVKDIVAKFLAWTSQTLWDEVLVAIVVIVLVAALNHIPAVGRAKADLKAKPPKDSILNRYLTLPAAFLLSVGYSLNQVARFGVVELNNYMTSELPVGATNVLGVVLQLTYWALMNHTIVALNARWTEQQEAKKDEDTRCKSHESVLVQFEEEVEHDVLDTMTRGLAFVYGWGLSDTLRAIYYPFFMGCPSYSACNYPEVWYFAIIVTCVLGLFIGKLSTQEYRSMSSKSYQTLMITAMSLTVGWAWMNVFSSTCNYFVDQWNSVYPHDWTALVCYLFLLIFAYLLIGQIYFTMVDEMRVVKRARKEFDEAYPCDAEAMSHFEAERTEASV